MKTLKRLLASLGLSFFIALGLGAGIQTSQSFEVPDNFAYGPPATQKLTEEPGMYTVKRYGFPSTYKETQTVALQSGAKGSYESKPFGLWLLAVNVVFWMSLLVALLSPVAIFFRPKKKAEKPTDTSNETKPPEAKPTNEAK